MDPRKSATRGIGQVAATIEEGCGAVVTVADGGARAAVRHGRGAVDGQPVRVAGGTGRAGSGRADPRRSGGAGPGRYGTEGATVGCLRTRLARRRCRRRGLAP